MIRGLSTTGLLLVALLTLGATPARAGLETFSATIPVTPVPYATTFTINGFDPTMGTLTGINITTTTSGTASISIVNIDSFSAHTFANAMAVFLFKLTDPTGAVLTTTSTAVEASGTVPDGSPFGFATFAGLPVSGMSSSNIGQADFGSFETSGGVNLNFGAGVLEGTYGGTENDGSSGNLFFGGSGSVGATIVVTYTYSPAAITPEPASIGLLCVGLVGMGGLSARRRFRRSAV